MAENKSQSGHGSLDDRHKHKYANRNPLHRFALNRFFDSIATEIKRIEPKRILDFGSGEGFFIDELMKRNVVIHQYLGIDTRQNALREAKSKYPQFSFVKTDLFHCALKTHFDLIIASQVLEHLSRPEEYLRSLCALSNGALLLTVPDEPWFRILNLLRGRDIKNRGNHPDHINLWSYRRFCEFVGEFATIERSYRSFPFSIVVGKPVRTHA